MSDVTVAQFAEVLKVPVDKLITHRFPLDEFVTGANMALEGKVLKAVFET